MRPGVFPGDPRMHTTDRTQSSFVEGVDRSTQRSFVGFVTLHGAAALLVGTLLVGLLRAL